MIRPTIFISYKRNDEATLEQVHRIEGLLAEAGLEVLRDTRIGAGERWSGELYEWMMGCSAAIALIGEAAAGSEWCRREWWLLRERHLFDSMPLIPVSVDDSRDSGGILDDIQNIRLAHEVDSTTFAGLETLENLAPSPERYLAAHRAWLRWQLEDMPMWGSEPFSLKDVYVETECGKLIWSEITDETRPRDPFVDKEECGGRHDLLETALALVLDPEQREPVVIQGPPGAGKSAFTLALAGRLSREGLKPVLVALS